MPVFIRDEVVVAKKRAAMVAAGESSLTVIADFDRTLTSFNVNGTTGATSHGLVDSSQLLSAEFHKKANALFRHYYPLEICEVLPWDEKYALMEEWWEKTHELLLTELITKPVLEKMVEGEENIGFRDGLIDMLSTLERNNVPVLVFSAGLGDIVEEVMRQRLPPFNNVHTISNFLEFSSADGPAIGFKNKKNIHTLNKGEIDVNEHQEFSKALKGRRHVLLLGDNLGDTHMSASIEYDNIITIGFLNDNVDSRFENYSKTFDIVITNDDNMATIADIISEVCGNFN